MAASLMRYTRKFPLAPREDEAIYKDRIIAQGSKASTWDLDRAKSFDLAPELKDSYPAGHPFGTAFTVSTQETVWVVDPASTDDRVTVHLTIRTVVSGAVQDEQYSAGAPTLEWHAGAWRIADMTPANNTLLRGGTSFTGGC